MDNQAERLTDPFSLCLCGRLSPCSFQMGAPAVSDRYRLAKNELAKRRRGHTGLRVEIKASGTKNG